MSNVKKKKSKKLKSGHKIRKLTNDDLAKVKASLLKGKKFSQFKHLYDALKKEKKKS